MAALAASIAALVVALQCKQSNYNVFVLQDQRRGDRFLALSNQSQVVSTVIAIDNIQKSILSEGSFTYQIMYLGSSYYASNNFIYDDPVIQYFSASQLAGSARLSLTVMLL